ncbi:aminoglycoside phosphotransferase family protein [Deinococcus planocerae]|uniref:aminoglycoside phosphotransferase family protein n=1 Tax=Deinococcus planocerae TaxID=1737569 RepID=UPI000C7F42A4|nr:aminoglycoside phosphotransferase family protein [Deinococcus planocerae]
MTHSIRATLRAVVTHPDGRRVAAVSGALPAAVVAENTFVGRGLTNAFPALSPWLAPLRRLHFARLGEDPDGTLVREAVWHFDAPQGLTGAAWVLPGELPENERGWAEAALIPAPPHRPPFARVGWAAGALAWLDEELGEQGLTRAGPPEPLKHWGISALWRVGLEGGGDPVYLKAVPAFLAREVTATCVLSGEIPGAAPPVLAADEGRGLLLMGHAGDVPGEDDDGTALAAHLARVQRASVTVLAELRSRGVPDHGPAWVAALLPELLRSDMLLLGEEGGLTPAEAARLWMLEGRLHEACVRLLTSPLPEVVGHGDLHRNNAARKGDGRWTLLDWSDASVTHPFLDADPLYLAPEGASPGTLEAAQTAYLTVWADLLPVDEGRALMQDARLVGEVYRALGYTHGIQPHIEDEDEMRTWPLEHLRRVLERAEAPVPPAPMPGQVSPTPLP